MVSSDFGKLDVKRHLISGEDCAVAGEAMAVAAAPAAETFKKSRRFIQASPHWGVHPGFPRAFPFGGANMASYGRSGGRSLTRKFARGIRDEGMTALIKRKSHMSGNRLRRRGSRPPADRGLLG